MNSSSKLDDQSFCGVITLFVVLRFSALSSRDVSFCELKCLDFIPPSLVTVLVSSRIIVPVVLMFVK